MEDRIEKVKAALKKPRTRVAGKIVDDGKDTVSIRMGDYLLEIPRKAVIGKEDGGEGVTILNLKPDAQILMTSVTPVDEMIGALSSRIVKGFVNADTECCDCTECSYCTDCTECSYCTDRGWRLRTSPLWGLIRVSRFTR